MKKNSIYNFILKKVELGEKLLCLLIDPDKATKSSLNKLLNLKNIGEFDLLFVGGSEVADEQTAKCIDLIKEHSKLPIVLFPGDLNQISSKADALLLLSLLSGRNSEYIIGKQIEASFSLQASGLEVISTAYILVDGGIESSVERVSSTSPLPKNNTQDILATALAGEQLGFKLIYLESGSGAAQNSNAELIQKLKNTISVPLIVGGGIKNMSTAISTWNAGADVVVVGNTLENDPHLFFDINRRSSK